MIRPEIIKLRDMALKGDIVYTYGSYDIKIDGLARLSYDRDVGVRVWLKNYVIYEINDEERIILNTIFENAINREREETKSKAIKEFENAIRCLGN